MKPVGAEKLEPFEATEEDDDALQLPCNIEDDKSHDSDVSGDQASVSSSHPQPQNETFEAFSAQSTPCAVVKVPRSKRAGLLGAFSLIYEAQEPKDFPRNIKWTITFFVAAAAMAAPMGSSIIYPALDEITNEFRTTHFKTNLSVALYMLAMSIFPLWWSAFSESAGRRTVYIISFTAYVVFNIVAAESTSIAMFVAFRVLAGGTSASVQAVGAGTIADIWEVKERGKAMGIFYLGPLCGPLLSPVVGGALTEGLGWRSTQWFQVIYGGVMVVSIICFLPETHKHSKLIAEAEEEAAATENLPATNASARNTFSRASSLPSVARRVKVRGRKWSILLKKIFVEPLKIVRYLRFPPVALVIYYASIAFGSLYFLNISVQSSFSTAPYDFSAIVIGLLYVSNSLGYIITSIIGGRWVDHIMAREARKAGRIDARGQLIYNPQDRMRENAWVGAVVMPIALIWYGWTVDRGVFWLVPILANFFFGVGSMLVFGMATTMLTEFLPKRASNGVALNNFVRNVFSFGGALLAEPALRAIGNGWLFTILGVVALASSSVILAMRQWGDKWRMHMEASLD